MFFFGGINSILPFIIYLSLVWICMLIGYSGRVKDITQFLSSGTEYTETHSAPEKNENFYLIHEIDSRIKKDQKKIKVSTELPYLQEQDHYGPISLKVSPEDQTTSCPDFLDHFYRGPPTIILLAGIPVPSAAQIS